MPAKQRFEALPYLRGTGRTGDREREKVWGREKKREKKREEERKRGRGEKKRERGKEGKKESEKEGEGEWRKELLVSVDLSSIQYCTF